MGRSQADEAEFTNFAIGFLVFLVALWALLSEHLSKRCKHVGEGSIACLLGLFAGLNLFIFSSASNKDINRAVESDMLVFNASVFFTYLLPPVIFYAGLSVEKQRFFSNITSILAYGVVGTFLCFAILGISLHYVSLGTIELRDSLALAAVFAATDSVATLQVLNPDSMPLLFSLVFGEGVMNDATSVVLLRAITDVKGDGSIITHILSNFAYLFVTSLALGGASGLLIAWALKHSKGLGPHQELALVGLLAYLSYLLGEVLSLSGILALFCCGLVVSHYALQNISLEGRTTTINTFRMLSTISEGSIFIYVGMDALAPINWQKAQPGQVLWLFLVVMLILVISRAAFVFPISLLHNYWSSDRLSSRDMVIIWWAGLIRGAVSVALAYYQFDSRSNQKQHSTFIVTTLLVVLATVLGLGAVTKPLLELMLRKVPGQSLAEALRDIPEVVRWRGPGSCGSRRGGGTNGSAGGWRMLQWWNQNDVGYKILGQDSPSALDGAGESTPGSPAGSDTVVKQVVAGNGNVGWEDDLAFSRNDSDRDPQKSEFRGQLEFGRIDNAVETSNPPAYPSHPHSSPLHPGASHSAEVGYRSPSTSTPSTSTRTPTTAHPTMIPPRFTPPPDPHPSASPTPPSVTPSAPRIIQAPPGSALARRQGSWMPASPFSSVRRQQGVGPADLMPAGSSKPTLSSMLYELWCTFDEEYMQPLFGAPPQEDGAEAPVERERMQEPMSQELSTSHHTLVVRNHTSADGAAARRHSDSQGAERLPHSPRHPAHATMPSLRQPQGILRPTCSEEHNA